MGRIKIYNQKNFTYKKDIFFLSVVFNGNREFYKEQLSKPISNYGKYKKEIEDYIKKILKIMLYSDLKGRYCFTLH